MIVKEWEAEFRRRVIENLARRHLEHGFADVAEFTWIGEDQTTDPTYGDTISARMEFDVHGLCPCGEKVYESAEGPAAVTELIRFITEPREPMSDEPKDRVRDPFRELTPVRRAAEEIEDAIDRIAWRYGVTVVDDVDHGGVLVVDDQDNEAPVIP